MDFSKLTNGDKVIAGSGLLLFISGFLPWFGKDVDVLGFHYGYRWKGWDVGFFTGTLPIVIGLLLIAYVVVTHLVDGVTLPELPVGWPLVALGLAGLAALLVILRLLVGGSVSGAGASVDLDRKYGIFIATIAALGLAGGAFLRFQEDGGELPNKKAGGTPGGDGSTPTPF